MPMRAPDRRELIEIAALNHFELTDQEATYFEHLVVAILANLDDLGHIAQPTNQHDYSERDPGARPHPDDDPLNAILRRCSVKGAPTGRLAGKRIGVKDCVLVAGVPMSCGSLMLDGYVPDRDAPVVTRMLDEGAEIVAKLNMDSMGFSGNGDTSSFGPVWNPHNREYLSGGSSSGSGAALYYDDIDLAIGCDSAGSIRIPASFCGVVGVKPTHGLVPQTDIVGLEPAIDHPGPMARSVADAALLLEVIADQPPGQSAVSFTGALAEGIKGLRIGVVKEGFAWGTSEPDVDDAVRRAIDGLRHLGASVEEVSIPLHRRAGRILASLVVEGMTTLLSNSGLTYDSRPQNHHLAAAMAQAMQSRAAHLPELLKGNLIMGTYLKRNYPGTVYHRGQNLRSLLRQHYDQALENFDLLAMPTTPQKAPRFDPAADTITRMLGTRHVSNNTAALNITGHPAVSLPCGKSNGLPVGLMLTGRYFDEPTILRAAHAYEQSYPWEQD